MAPSIKAAMPVKSRNAVLVHGLFADGSFWLDVIKRLQAGGLNVISIQSTRSTNDAPRSKVSKVGSA
jgi:hypothetical protein